MKDHKDAQSKIESQTFFEKIETATPTQAALSVIAQIMQKLAKLKKSGD